MPFSVYNLKNQALNAEKRREIDYFNTSNFGGIIADYSPFAISGDTISLRDSSVKFIGGGLRIDVQDEYNWSYSFTSDNRENMLVLEVTLDTARANIATDQLLDSNGFSAVKFAGYYCNPLVVDKTSYTLVPVEQPEGNPKEKGFYFYNEDENKFEPSEDTEVQPITYYYKIESLNCSFTTGGKNYTYYGNTIWMNENKFIIPICIKLPDGEVKTAAAVKSKESFEKLLSLGNYTELKNYVDSNFVWHEGGDTPTGKYRKGGIGDLVIADNCIRHKNNTNDNLSDRVRISNLQIDALANEENNFNSKIIVNPDGSLDVDPDYKVPVAAGGTFSENNWDELNPRRSAKFNLGIYYGSENPPATGVREGDIYFKIMGGPPAPTYGDIFNPVYPFRRRPNYRDLPPGHYDIVINPFTGKISRYSVYAIPSHGGRGRVTVRDGIPNARGDYFDFDHGKQCTLIATPAPGYRFSHWVNEVGEIIEGIGAIFTFTVVANLLLTAVFVPE